MLLGWVAGELAIQCSPEQLQPFAAPIVERLVPILAAPMSQMPRSIVENRSTLLLPLSVHARCCLTQTAHCFKGWHPGLAHTVLVCGQS